MTKKIVFFNGPPRSGKDTIVKQLISYFENSQEIKFSDPFKKALPVFFGLSSEQVETFEEDKESPRKELFCKSWRQVQISISEDWGKPHIGGKDIFGKIAVNKINNSDKELFLISDSGFREEAESIINEFGPENCLILRLYRDGCSFANDSRSYWIKPIHTTLQEYKIVNNGTIQGSVDFAKSLVERWNK